MRTMRFSKLYLLSQNERAALEISFSDRPTLVKAPNQHGKSAILKSLYEAFGALPHKIDNSWKAAKVTSLVKFSIENLEFAILKTAGTYSVFDKNLKLLMSTNKVSEELSPFLSRLFDFKLVMIDKKDQVVIPPPAYIFAPFYIDQDHGWTAPWSSFSRMYLPNSAKKLADYHSGIRTNEYYEALAERDKLQAQLKLLEAERNAIHEAIKKIRTASSEVTLSYELGEFSHETDLLVAESKNLHEAEVTHRERLASLNEERQLWIEQKNILDGAISEMDDSLTLAIKQPEHVECPTCGQAYENSLAEQFGLVEDLDGLIVARLNAGSKISEFDDIIRKCRSDLNDIQKYLAEIETIFAVRKAELTFRDVVAAEGRTEARRLLQARLTELDGDIGVLTSKIRDLANRIKDSESKDRAARIKAEFIDNLSDFSQTLDVRLVDRSKINLNGVNIDRGSAGPRALLAYYFAFLKIARKHSSCVFCPIVVDAPNQQGQDQTHMPAMMRLMIDEVPDNAQLIIASEDQFGLTHNDVDLIDVGGTKNHVLRLDQFDSVSKAVTPYLGRLIQ